MQVQQTIKWPAQFPFAVRIEPGTSNEEVVLVTSGLGSAGQPFTINRGYDNTAALTHTSGVSVIPGGIQADLADAQQHLNLTTSSSSAHGLPASVWGGGTMQLIRHLSFPASGHLIFNGIPATFSHLKLMYSLQGNGTDGFFAPGIDVMGISFSGTGFSSSNWQGVMQFQGSSPPASFQGAVSAAGAPLCAPIWNAYYGTPGAGMGEILIPFYTSSLYKTFLATSVATDGGGTGVQSTCAGGYQNSASAITGIELGAEGSSSAWTAGSASLYGIL
jgi:hypothetical protein